MYLSLMLGTTVLAPMAATDAGPAAKMSEARAMILTARYLSTLHSRVQRHWKPGLSLMELNKLSATVTLHIRPDGRLWKVSLARKSESRAFNRSLLGAVRSAQPFPAPPSFLAREANTTGLEVMFRKRVFRRNLAPLRRRWKGSAVAPDWSKPSKKAKKKRKGTKVKTAPVPRPGTGTPAGRKG